jgi:hypothetical protein
MTMMNMVGMAIMLAMTMVVVMMVAPVLAGMMVAGDRHRPLRGVMFGQEM